MTEPENARFYRDLLRAYIDSANDAIFVLCDEMKFLACNHVMQQWFGLAEGELTRHNARVPITELLGDPQSVEVFQQHFPQALSGGKPRFEILIAPAGGKPLWVEINLSRVVVEAGDMVMAVARDMTERREHVERVRHHATHDPLTGLPNRVLFTEQLASAIAPPARGALLVMDINRFRDINEHLGHSVGDVLLRATAQRLTVFAGAAPHARVGSNEFTVWLPELPEAAAVREAERLRAALSVPIGGEPGDLSIEVSVGIAQYPEHAEDAEALLRHAEVAMYRAKSKRLPVAHFDPRENQRNAERLRLMGDLRRAIEGGQLEVHYQPIVSLRVPVRRRVEALARWQHPVQGWIAPEEFIPLAEYTNGIHALTRRVVRRACEDCAPLLHAGLLEALSLNLSPLCLADPGFPAFLGETMELHRLSAGSVVLELTESAIMADPDMSQRALEQLRALGAELAVDDFGTGHSSLAKLRQFPVNELKIDRAFVRDMHRNEGDAAIVCAALQLAHTFGCRVVAEGVEDPGVRTLLAGYGCDYGQGHGIARPMPHVALLAWLDQPMTG